MHGFGSWKLRGATLWLALALVTCQGRNPSTEKPRTTAPSTHPSASPTPAPAPASSHSVAPPAPLPTPAAPCKAVGQKGNVPLGTLREQKVQLLSEAGNLYALGYTHELARVRLLRISRAGGTFETVAEQPKALSEPSRAVLHDGAVYYTQAGTFFRMGPQSGESKALHSAADSPPAVHGEHAYFVDCDRNGKTDRVVELALTSGESRTLAEIEHRSKKRCQYSSLVADERELLIADWNGQRILAIAKDGGTVRELVRKRGFVQELMLETDSLSFVSGRGLERADRSGEHAKLLVNDEKLSAPWSAATLHSGEYWFIDNIAYTTTTHIFRMSAQGGKPQIVAQFESKDPTATTQGDEFLMSYAVDDACLYFVREVSGQPGQLFARAK